ncbi:hypothetical protein AWB73_02150 [Caballeronia turbans]|jgi:cytochrome b subunit of formate dehydrogenase|nr:hypothetical protein AWB73_02150 [Caballeronia turbans]
MSTRRIPDVPEYKHIEPPSIWIAVLAFVVVFVAGFIVTILNWKQGESIVSANFSALHWASRFWSGVRSAACSIYPPRTGMPA